MEWSRLLDHPPLTVNNPAMRFFQPLKIRHHLTGMSFPSSTACWKERKLLVEKVNLTSTMPHNKHSSPSLPPSLLPPLSSQLSIPSKPSTHKKLLLLRYNPINLLNLLREEASGLMMEGRCPNPHHYVSRPCSPHMTMMRIVNISHEVHASTSLTPTSALSG